MPGRSYSKSGSKDYFEYIKKKNETFANNSAIKIYEQNGK